MGQKKRWRVRDLKLPNGHTPTCASCAWFIPDREDPQAQGKCFKTQLVQIRHGLCKLWERVEQLPTVPAK